MIKRRVRFIVMAVLMVVTASVGVASPSQATGQYDYYCTGYNGMTIGWNNKTFHACHGYLDVYISGNHVGHYVPDAYPTGSSAQLRCSKAAGSSLISILALGSPAKPFGWLYGAWTTVINVRDFAIYCRR